MADSGGRSTIIGCVGVLCLALYWVAMLFPPVANILPDSLFGRLVILGVWLASAPLTIIAAIRGSKCWWVAVGAAAVTLQNIYIHFFWVIGQRQYDRWLLVNAAVAHVKCGEELVSGFLTNQELARLERRISAKLLKLRVLRLGLVQDGNVGVGVFPESKKFLVGGKGVSARGIGIPGNRKVRTEPKVKSVSVPTGPVLQRNKDNLSVLLETATL